MQQSSYPNQPGHRPSATTSVTSLPEHIRLGRRADGEGPRDGRVVNVHALIATGVNTDGHREILGLDVASAEDGAGWLGWPFGTVPACTLDEDGAGALRDS